MMLRGGAILAILLVPVLLATALSPLGVNGAVASLPQSRGSHAPATAVERPAAPAIAPATRRSDAGTSGMIPHLAIAVESPIGLRETPRAAIPTPSAAASSSPEVGTGWVGLSSSDNAYWHQPPLSPPDVQVSVGPNHIMEMVNVVWSVWTKRGVPVSNGTLASFFGTGADFISDPKIQYDAASQRWFASITDVGGDKTVLAVSAGSDPTGSWQKWSFGSGVCYDQPILGVATSVVILSTNLFGSSCTGSFQGAEYWVIRKADLLAGMPSPRNQAFGPYPAWSSIHPAQLLGSSSAEYMVSANGSCSTCTSGNQILYFTVTGIPPSASVTWSSLTVGTMTLPPPAPQYGSPGHTIDTGDIRVQDAVWAAGNLWLGLDTQCTPPGDFGAKACVRLIEVNTTTGTVSQDFNVAQAGRYFYYPALRTDSVGDLLVTFGYSNSTTYPGVMATGRVYGDPVDTVQTPQIIHAGTGPVAAACSSSGVCRYGDYFGAGLDPSNGSLVWLAGESGAPSRYWSTYVFSASVKAVLTFDYNARGGGSGFVNPYVTYQSNGVRVNASLELAPTRYYADPGTGYSVPARVLRSSPAPSPGPPGEIWSVNASANGPPLTGTVSTSAVGNFTYFHQYLASLAYTVAGGPSDAICPEIRAVRFGQPLSQAIAVNGSQYLDAGTAYVYPTLLPPSPSAERWIANGGTVGTVSGPLNVTVGYFHQYQVTFDYQIRNGPSSRAPAVHYYSFGTNVTVTANATVWADALQFYVFDPSLSGAGENVRQGPGPGSVGTVSTSGTITMVYRTQYRLAVFASPGSLDAAVRGAGWYDAGASATLEAVAPNGWKFEAWAGAASGSNATFSLLMTGPANATAFFFAGLTITASDGGSVAYSYGTISGTVPAGSSVIVFVAPGTAVILIANPASWMEAFGAWSGATNGTSRTTLVIVDAPAAVFATFVFNTLLVAGVTAGILVAVTAGILVVLLVRRRRKGMPPA